MSVSLVNLRQIKGIFKINIQFRNYAKIAITNDGSTFVAHHPEEKFPYDKTMPIPETVIPENKSVLKMDNIKEIRKVFTTMNPEFAREELMRLTNTTKHRWFPKSRSKRAKQTPMDREYL